MFTTRNEYVTHRDEDYSQQAAGLFYAFCHSGLLEKYMGRH
jgi:hypothetical protein